MTPDDIKKLRQRLGLSQQGLADAINAENPLLSADRNIVSRWERGMNKPSVHYLAVLQVLATRPAGSRDPHTASQ